MKIYSIASDGAYDDYGIPSEIPDSVYYDISMESRGSAVEAHLLDRRLKLVKISNGIKGSSDFVCGDSWIVVGGRVKSKISERLKAFGQWIEIDGPFGSLFYFRVNNVIDVLDKSSSKYVEVTPTYKRLVKPVFYSEQDCESCFIFYQSKINSNLFVNQSFKDFVEKAGLTGLKFEEQQVS